MAYVPSGFVDTDLDFPQPGEWVLIHYQRELNPRKEHQTGWVSNSDLASWDVTGAVSLFAKIFIVCFPDGLVAKMHCDNIAPFAPRQYRFPKIQQGANLKLFLQAFLS